MNESLLYFEDGRNHVAFIIGKFDFEPRKSEQYLATAWRGFEAHKVCHINQPNTLPPLPPNRFFCHPDSGWSCDQPQPGSFFQRPREAEKRDPGNEVGNLQGKHVQRKIIPLKLSLISCHRDNNVIEAEKLQT